MVAHFHRHLQRRHPTSLVSNISPYCTRFCLPWCIRRGIPRGRQDVYKVDKEGKLVEKRDEKDEIMYEKDAEDETDSDGEPRRKPQYETERRWQFVPVFWGFKEVTVLYHEVRQSVLKKRSS